jgi:hypothetical protein
LNRRLRFWFALKPEGLECGPAKFGWIVPYEEVSLVRASYFEEPGEPYLEVNAGTKSAKVLMEPDEIEECFAALFSRCACAVWIDNRDNAHPPVALRTRASSELSRRAVENMNLLLQRYRQIVWRATAIVLVLLACVVCVGMTYVGIIRIDPQARTGVTISSLFFTALFVYVWVMTRKQMRKWEEVCGRFAGVASAENRNRGT